MATPAFSGALQPKKKAELQEIATALQISDLGTKEDLQNRIREYLEANQAKLEEEPAFAGLYGRTRRRRQGSAQPQPIINRFAASDESSPDRSPTRSSRRSAALEPVREITPVAVPEVVQEEEEDEAQEESNISSILGRLGLSPQSPSNAGALIVSPAKSLREMMPRPDAVMSIVRQREEQVTTERRYAIDAQDILKQFT